jgi:hypothetical protein
MNKGTAWLTGIGSLLLLGGVVWGSIESASNKGSTFVQAQVPGRGYDYRGGGQPVYRGPAPGPGNRGRPGVYGPTVGQRPEFITHLHNIHQGVGLVSQIVGLFTGNTPGSVNYGAIQEITMNDPAANAAYTAMQEAEYNIVQQRNSPWIPGYTWYKMSEYCGQWRTALWSYQRALQDAKCRMANVPQYCSPLTMSGAGGHYQQNHAMCRDY